MDKNNNDFWETLDTISIYAPKELIAYHIYLLELARKQKRGKDEKRELAIISSYKKREKKELEVTNV